MPPLVLSDGDVRDSSPYVQLFQTMLPRQQRIFESQSQRMAAPSSQTQPQTPRRQLLSALDNQASPTQIFYSPTLPNSDFLMDYFSNDVNDEFEDDSEDEEDIDDTTQYNVDIEERRLEAFKDLLSVPNRDNIRSITTISPLEYTIWFGTDPSKLTRKITRIFTNKFNGPFYTWRHVPHHRQEKYFLEFAKTYHWDLVHSGLTQNISKQFLIRE